MPKKLIIPGEQAGMERGKAKRRLSEAMAAQKATEKQWQLVSMAINAWTKEYPLEWWEFQKELKMGQSKYNDATGEGLKGVQFRNTAAFPIAYKKVAKASTIDSSGVFSVAKIEYDYEEDGLLPVLKNIVPGLTDKKSVNFAEFCKRYPQFRPSEKTNAGSY